MIHKMKKTVVDRPKLKYPQKAPKSPEFVDTDSDDSEDEQEPVIKQLQKPQGAQVQRMDKSPQ